MSENSRNGGDGIAHVAETLLVSLQKRRESLLADLTNGFPGIRKHLLGCQIGDRTYPAGTVRIECDSTECVVSLAIPMLGISARYSGTTADLLLEMIERDLDLEQVPWDHDWQTKKRMKEATRRSLGGP